MAPSLNSSPYETLDKIVKELGSKGDLTSAWLVSSRLSDVVRRILFESLKLDSHRGSGEAGKLYAESQHRTDSGPVSGR